MNLVGWKQTLLLILLTLEDICWVQEGNKPFKSQDLIVNSPTELLHISKNLVLDPDNNF